MVNGIQLMPGQIWSTKGSLVYILIVAAGSSDERCVEKVFYNAIPVKDTRQNSRKGMVVYHVYNEDGQKVYWSDFTGMTERRNSPMNLDTLVGFVEEVKVHAFPTMPPSVLNSCTQMLLPRAKTEVQSDIQRADAEEQSRMSAELERLMRRSPGHAQLDRKRVYFERREAALKILVGLIDSHKLGDKISWDELVDNAVKLADALNNALTEEGK